MRIGAKLQDEQLHQRLAQAAGGLGAELVLLEDPTKVEPDAAAPDVMVLELTAQTDLVGWRTWTRTAGAALILWCDDLATCSDPVLLGADEWLAADASTDEVRLRLRQAVRQQRLRPQSSTEAADLIRYQELLFDKLTGFPTLPVMI